MQYNAIIDTDSYKFSHFLQFPPGTEELYFYMESRGGAFEKTVFFGLQYFLMEYLSQPISVADVKQAQAYANLHGEPFNYEGWMYIATELEGKIPLKIDAVPEGSVIPTHNVLLTAVSTDPKVPWVASWFETQILRLWYPITVASQSYYIRDIIYKALQKSSDHPDDELMFKLHDFGSRGVSSRESAAIGGAAHLTSFMGSDTCIGVLMANSYYDIEMAGFSIPASEHSTMTSWGQENEVDAYRNMIKQFGKPGKIFAVVSDSYDLDNAVNNIWGKELKDELIASGATLVIRPDSGEPVEVVLKVLKSLEASFGTTLNTKGYKVLPSCVRVIQGDGVNKDSIRLILGTMMENGFSATNITFGSGGALLQKVDRDTQKFAYKCSSIKLEGNIYRGVQKNPVDDPGKASRAGKLKLIQVEDDCYTLSEDDVVEDRHPSKLETVFLNGDILKKCTFDEIRQRVNESFKKDDA